MSSETVLFEHPTGIRVTNARANLGPRTYAMANVTSVTMGRTPAKRGFGWALTALGVMMTLAGISDGVGGLAGVGVLILGVGLALALLPKDRFHVLLGSASGEQEALTSTDRGFIQEIVDALNEAIIRRG